MNKTIATLWPAATVNFCYYSVFGGVISYLAIFLTSRDFSSAEIGQLFAIYTISRVVAGQVWAWLSDRKGDPRLFFQLGLILTFLFFLPAWFTEHKWLLFTCITLAMTCFMSVVSQIEVLSMMAAKDEPVLYNRIRLFGSLGFIAAALLVGWQIDHLGAELVIVFGLLSIVATGLVSTRLKVNNHVVTTNSDGTLDDDFGLRCRQLGFVIFMLASVLLQVSFAPYISFFTKFLAEQGYQGMEIGVLFSLGTLAEIFLFVYAGRLLGRLDLKLIMTVCLLLTALRWWALAHLVDSWVVVVVTQLGHAFSFGLMHSASIYFIRQQFTSRQQNRGQFMYLGITYGVGGAIGMALTGLTWNNGLGGANTFVWAGWAVFLAALLILMTPRKNFQFDVMKARV